MGSGRAVKGPDGLSPTATPMRKRLDLSRAGKKRWYLPVFAL